MMVFEDKVVSVVVSHIYICMYTIASTTKQIIMAMIKNPARASNGEYWRGRQSPASAAVQPPVGWLTPHDPQATVVV